MKIVGKHIRTSNHSQRSKSWQKSKDNVLGNKKHANPKKFDQGPLIIGVMLMSMLIALMELPT